MSLLAYDWIACAALALCAGGFGPASWTVRIPLCGAIGLLGWAASFPLMLVGTRLGYDTSLAEDYINGTDVWNSAIAIAVAAAWALLWLCCGPAAASLWRRIVRAVR